VDLVADPERLLDEDEHAGDDVPDDALECDTDRECAGEPGRDQRTENERVARHVETNAERDPGDEPVCRFQRRGMDVLVDISCVQCSVE